jgi:hypothetical protein
VPIELPVPSRRAFLTAGAGAAVTALLSGCSGGHRALREKVRGSAKVPKADIPALNALLDVEHYAIAAYAAGGPLLHAPQSTAATQFLAHELAHALQLSDLIHQAGAEPRRPRASYDLGHPRTADDVVALLKRLERLQIRTYLETIPRLSGGRVRAAMAAILANDAQHLAMLRWQAGGPPAPAALVTGS